MTYDVAVVGGGIVGAATAYSLTRRGARTVLIDHATRGRATDAAAGLLSPLTFAEHSEAAAGFTASANDYYRRLASELAEAGAEDVGYQRKSLLIVAVDEDECSSFATLAAQVARRGGHPLDDGASRCREISPHEACSLHPHLRAPQRVLFVPDAAQVDGRALTTALLGIGERSGLAVLAGRIAALSLSRDRIAALHTDSERIAADQYVFAGGAWTPQLTLQLGFMLPVAPQRGQLAHLRRTDIDFSELPVLKGFRGHYLLPGRDGRVIAGATREAGSGFDSAATAGGVVQVLDEAVRLVPALDQADMLEVRSGLRPVTPDGLPAIGRIPSTANLWLSAGHGSHGLQLGPYSGHVVATAILDGRIDLPKTFSPERFCS